MPTSARYSAVAIALHWVIAIGILFMIGLGWNMDGSERLYQLHKSIGITILLLTVARIVWRLMNPPPALPDEMKSWEKALSHGVHIAFYGLMILMPLSGWLLVSTSYEFDVPTVLYGLVSWPDLPGVGFLANEGGHGTVQFVHSKLAWVAIGLLGLHVAGAVKHELSAEEGVLKRMIPGLFGKTTKPVAAPASFLAAFGGAIALFAIVAAIPALSGGSTNRVDTTNATPGDDFQANWAVDYDASRIAFSGSYDGANYSGNFADWTATIRFDENNPDDAAARVTVQTASANAGKKLYTDSLKSAEWFDVSEHPTATVILSNFRQATDERFEADATLKLKDTTVTVPFAFSLVIDGDTARMNGQTVLKRTPLDLGQQSDPSADWVGEDVSVDVTLEASRIE